jgi:vacuolar-type H+-ATPase subunit E/Vma4
LNVARLANLPSDLISVAKMHSSKLEAEVRTKSLEASVRMLYEVMVNCGETPDVDKFKQLQAQLSLVEARK